MVIVRVVGVFTALEQRAELDRLVGLVVVHGPDVQADQAQRQARRQGDRDEKPRSKAGSPTVAPLPGGGAKVGHLAAP